MSTRSTSQKDLAPKSGIIPEPEKYSDLLRYMKGAWNFHEVYNEFYKGAHIFHSMLDELMESTSQETIPNEIKLDMDAVNQINQIYRGTVYLQIIRDPIETNKIISKELFCTGKKPEGESYQLPNVNELDPLSHVNDPGSVIELETPQPISFGWYGLSLDVIYRYGFRNVDGSRKFTSTDQIIYAPLRHKSRYVSKTYYFKIIRVLRRAWEKRQKRLNPKTHEKIIEAKYGKKSEYRAEPKVFG